MTGITKKYINLSAGIEAVINLLPVLNVLDLSIPKELQQCDVVPTKEAKATKPRRGEREPYTDSLD